MMNFPSISWVYKLELLPSGVPGALNRAGWGGTRRTILEIYDEIEIQIERMNWYESAVTLAINSSFWKTKQSKLLTDILIDFDFNLVRTRRFLPDLES